MSSQDSSKNKPEPTKGYREDKAGPQGTLVFDSKEVDRMIAAEIQKLEDDGTKIPALLATTKPHAGTAFILDYGKNVIGRGKGNSVTIYDPAASSTHAQITYYNGEWKILNLLSSNGTIVNGEKISERELTFGDKIQVGHTEFLFTLVDSQEEEDDEKAEINWMLVGSLGIAALLLIGVLIWLFL
ncbi:FHA domain-containing protein [Kangiella geojedonensis]|uniref:FHA domain containing protein n=1 Tax=Kangiella geojedonensis TaxID=914150 RepID=A0A0F6RBE9_9GAMM|nr:FHA domain-containing protein [Kangiella geojedonensis]AKE51498.1 FHA domain containing protein [Kangiella geojedonensis]